MAGVIDRSLKSVGKILYRKTSEEAAFSYLKKEAHFITLSAEAMAYPDYEGGLFQRAYKKWMAQMLKIYAPEQSDRISRRLTAVVFFTFASKLLAGNLEDPIKIQSALQKSENIQSLLIREILNSNNYEDLVKTAMDHIKKH